MKRAHSEPTDEQIDAIWCFALDKYSNMDYTHGKSHAERTVKLAEFIAAKEEADPLISRLGAMLHQFHPEEADRVESFMRELGLEADLISAVKHCVSCVEPETIGQASTIEARVVFDADKLQTLGPFGLVREIIHRTVTRDLDVLEVVRQAEELQNSVLELLQTETGKALGRMCTKTTREFLDCFWRWSDLSFLV
ncbi:hypothetical protein EU538_03450 [Candidatus Thorarchaeota archaeon]|nr:MAG: hypothetical protein EU538_03450 [Candidatus Thorarchaeota archaeon]